jgi:hypothetical protein
VLRGLSWSKGRPGFTILTVGSDDNYNRTHMSFICREEGAPLSYVCNSYFVILWLLGYCPN